MAPNTYPRAHAPWWIRPLLLAGQELYFSSVAAAKTYATDPRGYWLAPHDTPLQGMDGKRGLPDLRGTNQSCPESGETFIVNMQTPRVIHKHGQNLYFCCFGCVAGFWTSPEDVINKVGFASL